MFSEILKLIHTVTIFQFFFFGWVVLFIRPKREFNYWLSAFLFLHFLAFLLIFENIYLNWFPSADTNMKIYIPIAFLYCPVFYVFVLKVCQKEINYALLLIPILIPIGIAYVFYFFIGEYFTSNKVLALLLWNSNYRLQSIFFLILALREFFIYKKNLGNYYSEDTIQRLKWLKFVILGFIFLWTLSVLLDIIVVFYPEGEHSNLFNNTYTVFLVANIAVLFLGVIQRIQAGDIPKESINKYSFSTLTDQEKNKILSKLNSFMEDSEFYKTPNISLKMLSEELDLQAKHLSQVINECMEQNFCEYINSLRINEAKKLFDNPKNDKKTILEIIYESGFNSKSVFNSVFKEDTGLTPSSYRKLRK